jgi:quaternary ammonium compound-resistance protein SugE
MAWLMLAVAAGFEILWAYTLKASEGFTRPWIVVVMLASLVAATCLLSLAMKTLPLGTAYAVWTGAGIVGTVIIGIFVYGEDASLLRLGAVGLIVAGILALRAIEG